MHLLQNMPSTPKFCRNWCSCSGGMCSATYAAHSEGKRCTGCECMLDTMTRQSENWQLLKWKKLVLGRKIWLELMMCQRSCLQTYTDFGNTTYYVQCRCTCRWVRNHKVQINAEWFDPFPGKSWSLKWLGRTTCVGQNIKFYFPLAYVSITWALHWMREALGKDLHEAKLFRTDIKRLHNFSKTAPLNTVPNRRVLDASP